MRRGPRGAETILGRFGVFGPLNARTTAILTLRAPSVLPRRGNLPLEPNKLFLHLALPVPKQTIVTTFNNGSLGSGIDEERSEMR